jgi:hypothetical protein
MAKQGMSLIVIGCSVEISLQTGIQERGVVVALSEAKNTCDIGFEDGGDVVVVYDIPLSVVTFVAPIVKPAAIDAPPPGWAPGCGPPFKKGEVVVVMKSSPVLGGERGVVEKFDHSTQSVNIRHMENNIVFEEVPSTYGSLKQKIHFQSPLLSSPAHVPALLYSHIMNSLFGPIFFVHFSNCVCVYFEIHIASV